MTQHQPIIVEYHGTVALVTLNRPEAYNALNHDLSTAIVRTFDELATNTSVHVIVLTGAGKAFCAGVDLKELTANPGVLKDGGMGTNSPMVRALRNCGKPIIDAETAMAWGLVNKLCPSDTLIEDTLAAAQQIAESNPQTISAMRSLMNDGDLLALGDALELEGARGIAYLEQADFSQMESRLQALRSRAQST